MFRASKKSSHARANTSAHWLGCLLLFTTPAFAISEAEFIQKVLAQDALLEEAQIGLDIKQIELDTSRDSYQNWKAYLSVELGYRYQDLDRDTNSRSIYTKHSESNPQKIGLALEKRFLSNPASLALGISHSEDQTDTDHYKKLVPEYQKDEKENATTQYFSVTYPLLKHNSNASSLKTYHRDILDLKRQQLLFYETKEDFLMDRLSDYLSWYLYQQQMSINQGFLNQLGLLAPKDDAETALLQSTRYQIEKYNSDTALQLHAIQKRLSILLNDEMILSETPQFDLQKRNELITKSLSAYLQRRNRTLQRTALSLELKEIDIKYYRNQNLPTLDFTVRAEQYTSSDNYIRSDKPTNRYRNDDKTSYSAGLTFRYPLGGNVTNEANLDKSLLGVRKLEIGYRDQLQDILADLQRLNTLLNVDEERLLGAIRAATRSTEIERQKYDAGKTTFRDLLLAYKDERLARLDHIDTLVTYQVNSIRYDNLLDRIIATPCHATANQCPVQSGN